MTNHKAASEPTQLRELTVGQLIEQLQDLPSHHYVSPMVEGVLGAGIAVWQMFDPHTHDTLVVFGEPKRPTSPIVPPAWSRSTRPGPESDNAECLHQWLDRPESDTRECLICGMEVAG